MRFVKRVVFMLAVVSLMALPSFAGGKVQTEPVPNSIVPAEVRAAIDQAVQDPVLSTDYLLAVSQDAAMRKYLNAYPSLTVTINGTAITFPADGDVRLEQSFEGTKLGAVLSVETREFDCEGSSDRHVLCQDIKEFLATTKRSVFWAQVRQVVAATATPAPTRTAQRK